MDDKTGRPLCRIDRATLIILGCFTFGYSVFWTSFAKLYIQLPFLDFPVFVGEVLLAVCLFLLAAKWGIKPVQMNAWYWLLAAYAAWVLVKAVGGYRAFGPLSFRNAALFYYP